MAPLKRARSLAFLRWLFLLPIPVIWSVIDHFGGLTFLENKSLDLRFQYRGEVSAPLKVVYVDVDSLSLSEIGGWPWSRDYFATVCAALINVAQVKAIGLDFVFSETGMSESIDREKFIRGNVALSRFLFREPPVVLAASYSGARYSDILNRQALRELPLIAVETRPWNKIAPPELPAFDTSYTAERTLYNPPFVGLIDTLDGGTRWVPMWAPTSYQRNYYHMAVELARLYWGLPIGAIRVAGDRLELVRADDGIQTRIPLSDGQHLEINWFTSWHSREDLHLPFSDAYKFASARADEDPELRKLGHDYFARDEFKDAIVLIGPVDPMLQDLARTPFHEEPVPKVGVHGNLLKTIVSGKYIQRLPAWTNILIVFGLAILATALSLGGGTRAVLAVLSVALYVALAFKMFAFSHTVLPLSGPLGAALTTSFAGLVWQVVEARKAKGRIKGMFGAYVSPQLVDRMVESGEDPQLGGHDAEITAYFSDIQGFSTFSEKLGSGPLVQLMNEYLTACTDIVQDEGGTLDKYIGDAVVAMFGAPIAMSDHAYRACVASQRVQKKIGELRAKWKSEGEHWPEMVWEMQSRIGLNTGVCMIGNMGSRTRFNYTMMGDDVNLAARMESGAKTWGAYTMVTQATKTACERHGGDRIVFRSLGRVVVMGRSQPVPIFEILGLKESLPDRARECIAIFEEGLAKYGAREWEAARALFQQSSLLEPNQPGRTPGVKTNPSLVYIGMAEACRKTPPPESWDGAYVMTEK